MILAKLSRSKFKIYFKQKWDLFYLKHACIGNNEWNYFASQFEVSGLDQSMVYRRPISYSLSLISVIVTVSKGCLHFGIMSYFIITHLLHMWSHKSFCEVIEIFVKSIRLLWSHLGFCEIIKDVVKLYRLLWSYLKLWVKYDIILKSTVFFWSMAVVVGQLFRDRSCNKSWRDFLCPLSHSLWFKTLIANFETTSYILSRFFSLHVLLNSGY